MEAVKRFKRRAVQKVVHTSANAEYTLHDPEFELAVQRFHALEKQLNSIVSKLKDARKATERYAAVHAALGTYMCVPFTEPGTVDGASHESFNVADCLVKACDPLSRSCVAVLQTQAIDELEALLKSAFPGRKNLIEAHAGLRLDVESYRRRLKMLEDKGKEAEDSSVIKIARKLERTRRDYNSKHEELLQDLNDFYNRRHSFLEPAYGAFVAGQIEFHGYLFSKLSEVSFADDARASDFVNRATDSVRAMVEGGGPAFKVKSKPKEKAFSRFVHRWNSKRSSKSELAVPDATMSGGDMGMAAEDPAFTAGGGGGGGNQEAGSPNEVGAAPGEEGEAKLGPVSANASDADQATQYKKEDSGAMAAAAAGSPAPGSPYHLMNEFRHGQQSSGPPLSPRSRTGSPGSGGNEAESPLSGPATGGATLPTGSPGPGSPGFGQESKAGAGTSGKAASSARQGGAASSPTGIPEIPLGGDSSKPKFFRATFPFTGTEAVDLSFEAGDIITAIKQLDKSWWKGELNGRQGHFPITYVEPYHQ